MEDLKEEISPTIEGNKSYFIEKQYPENGTAREIPPEAPRLKEVRMKFGVFGGLSLVYGLAYSILFYKTGRGLNVFVFSAILVFLQILIMSKLSVTIKKGTKGLYLAIVLLGLSTALTMNEIIQLFNSLGILLLLEISMIHQFYEDKSWDPFHYLGKMVYFLFQTIASIGKPFSHGIDFFKKVKLFKNETFLHIVLGGVIGLPILLIVLSLLASADMVFSSITKDVFEIFFHEDIIYILFKTCIAVITCYCIICGLVSGRGEKGAIQKEKASATIAITFMSIVAFIYVIFCGIQVAYLFQNDFFVLPSDVTYAEYARSGFFELVVVTFINIVLILVGSILFKVNRGLQIIMTIISGCTYIMMISATYRMFMYVESYGFTFLRLFVLLFLLIDALVLAGVIRYIYHKRFPLFYYSVTVVTVCYLIFSFAKVDYWIAKDYVARNEIITMEGMFFLTGDLSEDAAPIVIPYISDFSEEGRDKLASYEIHVNDIRENNENYYWRIQNEWENRDVRDLNLSLYLAKKSKN